VCVVCGGFGAETNTVPGPLSIPLHISGSRHLSVITVPSSPSGVGITHGCEYVLGFTCCGIRLVHTSTWLAASLRHWLRPVSGAATRATLDTSHCALSHWCEQRLAKHLARSPSRSQASPTHVALQGVHHRALLVGRVRHHKAAALRPPASASSSTSTSTTTTTTCNRCIGMAGCSMRGLTWRRSLLIACAVC
jgi:hypothetical protein